MTHELRVQAVSQVTDRTPLPHKVPQRLEALWAADVFTLSKMQASLPKDVYKSVKNTIQTSGKLAVTPLGMSLALRICLRTPTEQRSAFRLHSSHGPAKSSTRRHRCSVR